MNCIPPRTVCTSLSPSLREVPLPEGEARAVCELQASPQTEIYRPIHRCPPQPWLSRRSSWRGVPERTRWADLNVSVKSTGVEVGCSPPPDIDSTGSEIVLGVGAVEFILFCTQMVHSMAAGTARFVRPLNLRCSLFSEAKSSIGMDPGCSQWLFGSS